MLTLKLTPIQVLALAGVAVAIGIWLRRKVPLLERLHIPAPIVGGMLFALITLLLRDRWLNFEVDTVLRDVLAIASFTAIGLNASLRILRKGGVFVLLMAGLALTGGVIQAFLGMGLAAALGLDPRTGILAGTASLAGGPATALAFGSTFESLGVRGATTVGVTSATFGIAVAGLIAGWTGGRLIRTHQLAPAPDSAAQTVVETTHRPPASLLTHAILITIAMGVGSLISLTIQRAGIILPAFVGAMLAAVAIRNLDERYNWFRIDTRTVEQLVTISLSLFIAMAMLTLKLWELSALALPLLVILVVQVVVTWAFCAWVAFRILGRDYEAAVMTAGFTGFMIGITPNAMASMEELTGRFGAARRAMLVVPLVGAFLVDVTNSLVITTLATFFR